MKILRHSAWIVALFLLGPVLSDALAQAPQGTPTRIRGTVEKLDGNTLMVKSRDGQDLTIKLADNYAVRGVVKKSLSDIKPGDYVASTGMKGTDGKLHAVEVRIFPEALRGAGEGQFPWDLMPDSIMTNATVAQISAAPQGQTLKVSYKGTESEYMVGPEVPILGYVSADASLLKPGSAVFIGALKQSDGTLTSNAVTAEKDGVKPPM
ncbi:MAG TPA: hypothetical protein VGB82_12600 [Alphaproteobacteria bacterium]